jgi:hypothetical protein
MNNIKSTVVPSLLLAAALGAPSVAADEADKATNLAEAIKEGDVTLSLRLRYEDVEQETSSGSDKEADSFTLKTRLTYKTADYQGFSALVEMDDVTELDSVDYNTAPNDSSFPDAAIIADPEGTEVNQAWLAYKFGKNTLTYGRQRILLDNQRFVGGVGFRQNEQTYDGISFKSKALKDTEIFVAHINRVNRIFGEDSALGDHDNSTVLLNVSYSGLPIGKLTGYHYNIDNDNVANMSTKTTGVRLAGKHKQLGYNLEYATQSDAHDNSRRYDADYFLLEGSAKLGTFNFKLGHEVLGADGDDGYFITPLATLHKFQGWSDKFLNKGVGNVTGGLTDTYASVGTKVAGVKLALVYHMISADDDSAAGTDDYGREFGFVATRKFGPVTLNLKYADFSEDVDSTALTQFTDTSKLWLTASAKF